MTKSLNGAHILVTRPEHQAKNLCQLVENYGGIAVRYPTLKIVALHQQNFATFSTKKLSNLNWIIFTSANAVNFALQGNSGKIRQFILINIAAIGQATAKALESAGLKVNLIPENGYNSGALLEMPEMQKIDGKKVLVVRGQGGRAELAQELNNRGAIVEYMEVYKRIIPDHDNTLIYELLDKKKLAVTTATSGEALDNLLTMIDLKYHDMFKIIPLVVISDRIRQLAVNKGFSRVTVSADPSDKAIVNTVMTAINGE